MSDEYLNKPLSFGSSSRKYINTIFKYKIL